MMNILAWMDSSSKGLGDTLKKVTAKVGIKPCAPCEKRAEMLNQKFPYQKKP